MTCRCAWWRLRWNQMRSEWCRTDRYVTLPPPPGRRVPRRSINTGEGGWAPWRLMLDRDTGKASRADLRLRWPRRDRRLGGQGGSGASGGHGGYGDSGGHGVSGASGGHGVSGASGGHGGYGDSGGHGGSGASGGHGGIFSWEGLDRGAIVALTKVPCMATMATRTTGIWPPQKSFLGGSPAGGHSGSAGS